MRDLEHSLAITAAETGHLVLATTTGNAARTLDRVLDVFPNDQRDQIRIMVSESPGNHIPTANSEATQ